MLRVILRPLQWPFAILYTLSEDLVPILESPVPVLVGVNMGREEMGKEGYNFEEYGVVDLGEMKFVRMDEGVRKIIEGSVGKLSKLLETKHNRVSTVEWFIKSKLSLIRRGILAEMDEF